jgi:peptide/nickel transport system substrate-binding protein
VTRNSDYWKQGRPYLDGIEYTIIKNLSTANLAFIAGTFDMTFPYALSVPLLKDVNRQSRPVERGATPKPRILAFHQFS